MPVTVVDGSELAPVDEPSPDLDYHELFALCSRVMQRLRRLPQPIRCLFRLPGPQLVANFDAPNRDGYTFVDVREKDETRLGFIPGAVLLPRGFLRAREGLRLQGSPFDCSVPG